MPQRMDRGIGIVGAGGIVNYAHLPAYKKAGFKVVGITDKNHEQAERLQNNTASPRYMQRSTNCCAIATLKLRT